jgi:hypothetical protein
MIWLANTILVLHALLVLFIVGGLVAIWVGAAFRQGWVCNRAFRLTHLVAIGIVAALAALDVPCPLTVLEDWRLAVLRLADLGVRHRLCGVFAGGGGHLVAHSAARMSGGAARCPKRLQHVRRAGGARCAVVQGL